MKKFFLLTALLCTMLSNNLYSQTVPLRVYNNTPSTIWVQNVYVSEHPTCGGLYDGGFATTAIPPSGFADFLPFMGAGYEWVSLSVVGYGGSSNLAAFHPYANTCFGPSTSPTMTDTWGGVPSGFPHQKVVIN